MKPITREDWLKNPQPRNMLVWDEGGDGCCSYGKKKVLKVIYITTEKTFPVVTVNPDDTQVEQYEFCAEIEKPRRMTYQELSWWLTEKPHREYKYRDKPFVYNKFYYSESQQDESVPAKIVIRGNGGAWKEPLIEVEQ